MFFLFPLLLRLMSSFFLVALTSVTFQHYTLSKRIKKKSIKIEEQRRQWMSSRNITDSRLSHPHTQEISCHFIHTIEQRHKSHFIPVFQESKYFILRMQSLYVMAI